MNPLTQVRNTQKASRFEVAQGFDENASWHARFKHSAYVFAGGLPFELSEGDILAIFAQYGEPIDVNVIKDKDSGKSRGFAFVAYEDQRSTTLAVDNLSGTRVTGRVIRVEHVDRYKAKKAEVEGREPSPESPQSAEPNQPGRTNLIQAQPSGMAATDAPWMNNNSIVSMLTQSPQHPQSQSNEVAASKTSKYVKSKNKEAKKDHKKRHRDKLGKSRKHVRSQN